MSAGTAAGISAIALIAIAGGLAGRIRGGDEPTPDQMVLLPARPIGVDSSLSILVTEQLHSELVAWETRFVVLREEAGSWWNRLRGSLEEELTAGIGRRVAARVGAGVVLIPSVSRSGNRILLSASLLEAPGGQLLAAARASGPPDSLGTIVHALVVQLAAKEKGIPADRIATLWRHDPAAVRLFVRSHPHESEVRDRLLREAIALDGTFALAALELYESFDDYVTPDGDDPSAVEAAAAWDGVAAIVWENRDDLSPADRSYAEALLGWRYNEEHTAELHVAAWERAVEVAPDRLEHWQGLFHECFRWCSSYRWAWQEPLLEVHDELLARGDSSFLERAMEVAFFLGDTARLRLYERWLPADAWYGRWLAASGLGREADRAKVVQNMPDLSNSYLMRIGNAAIMTGLGLEDAEREALIREKGSPGSIYSLRQTVLARERGRHAEYRRLRDKLFQYFDVRTGTDAIGAANVIFEWGFFAEPETDETLDEIDGMLSRIVSQGKEGSPDSLAVAHCYRAQLRLLRADTTDVAQAVRFLQTDPAVRGLALSRMCAPFLEYMATRGEGQKAHAAAAGRLHDVMRDRPLTLGRGPGLFFVDINLAASVNLELARSFGELGHPETGLQVAERRPYQASFWGLYGFHIDFVRQEARLLAQAGETDAALARYEKYFRLRPEPPDLESWADEWEVVRAEYEALRESAVG